MQNKKRVEEQEEEAKGLRLAQSLKNDYYLNRRLDTASLQIAVKGLKSVRVCVLGRVIRHIQMAASSTCT